MKYIILDTDEYYDWFDQQTARDQVQIEKRLSKIETEGYFGHHKELEAGGVGIKVG